MSTNTVVKYKVGKDTFEIICKSETVMRYRNGKLSRDKVLVSDVIYQDANKGNRAKASDLSKIFGTTDQSQIVEKILIEGEYKLTTKENREKIDQQRRAIVNYIHTNFVDPKSGLPHPATRIDEVLTQIKLRVDPDTPAEYQFLKVRRQINDVIALKSLETMVTSATSVVPYKTESSSTKKNQKPKK